MENYQLEIRRITTEEYQLLRSTTNWSPVEDSAVIKALEHDLFSVCVMFRDQIVGMARIIGDGSIYFHLQDVIVHPNHKTKGVGRLMMDAIDQYVQANATNNAVVGLMAAEGSSEFYRKFGYQERPADRPGMHRRITRQ